jgi:hypothetical protein
VAHVTTARRRVSALKRIRRAALHTVRHRGAIGYTQGGRRWDFIHHRCKPWQHANWADCSAHATWLHWTATARVYGTYDYVNGYRWAAGYTGTQWNHGIRLRAPKLVGDLIFYGWRNGIPTHVATYIGGGLAVSHGSGVGPIIVRWNYRPVTGVRRPLH